MARFHCVREVALREQRGSSRVWHDVSAVGAPCVKPALGSRGWLRLRVAEAGCWRQARPGLNSNGPGRVAANIPPPFPVADSRSAPPRGLQLVNEQGPASHRNQYITRFSVFASLFLFDAALREQSAGSGPRMLSGEERGKRCAVLFPCHLRRIWKTRREAEKWGQKNLRSLLFDVFLDASINHAAIPNL